MSTAPASQDGFAPLALRRLADNPLLADGLADLLSEPQRWIRRRVERVELHSLEEVATVVTVDMHLDAKDQCRVAVDDGQRVLVPFAFGTKGIPLSRFDLQVDGKAGSLLSFPENQILTAAALSRLLLRDGLAVNQWALHHVCGVADDPRATSDYEAVKWAAWIAGLPLERSLAWLEAMRWKYVMWATLPVIKTDRLTGASGFELQRHLRYAKTDPLNPSPAQHSEPTRRRVAAAARRNFPTSFNALVELSDVGFGARFHLDLGVDDALRFSAARLIDANSGSIIGKPQNNVDRVTLETPLEERPAGSLETLKADVHVVAQRSLLAREASVVHAVMAFVSVLALVAFSADVQELPPGILGLLASPVLAALAVTLRSVPDPLASYLSRRPRNALAGQTVVTVFSLLALQLAVSLQWSQVDSALAAVRLGTAGPTMRSVLEIAFVAGASVFIVAAGLVQYSAWRSAVKELS